MSDRIYPEQDLTEKIIGAGIEVPRYFCVTAQLSLRALFAKQSPALIATFADHRGDCFVAHYAPRNDG